MADTSANYRNIGDGSVKSVTPGTAVQFTSTDTGCRMLHVTAFAENVNTVVVGASTVLATVGSRRGVAFAPGETKVIPVANVNMLWLDALTAADGVSYVYYKTTD